MSEEQQEPNGEVAETTTEPESAAEPDARSSDIDPGVTPDITIARLEEELRAAKEQALRAAAEAQNIQRRAQMDVEKAHKYGQEKLINDLLAVVDNLERALATEIELSDTAKAVVEGVELTLKALVDTLKRHNVETIDPVGEPFDPQLHQAMTAVPNGDMEPNTVMEVFQKGYTLHGRLVRPAMVVVSKALDG